MPLKSFNGKNVEVKNGFYRGMQTLAIFITKIMAGRRNVQFFSLEDGDKVITGDKDLREHIEGYYK